MTQDDIIRMAGESGMTYAPRTGWVVGSIARLERFAALVAAAEREACAKVCDSKVAAEYATGKVDHNEIGWTQSCAADIRARGGGNA